MRGKCPHKKVKKRRLSHKIARSDKFQVKGDDVVYNSLKKVESGVEAEMNPLPMDKNLFRMGQFYCMHFDRYFPMVRSFSKKPKKRKKIMAGPSPQKQLDVDFAARMGMPDNSPKLMFI
ncbi:hypothetical protein GIB67_028513 [Kingdonia uniflora]|uniref:Uncharacterized protein n=1 Tax=Kingdonia uniflora TaxID=39325 RepID=A0A7J7KVZ9_9MAGN|nr:hypothetical protein GIB67_028513 [Kingdonia uniflora]